ncbi:cell division protein FtsQ [Pedobacter aquatilis]|uniref:cell division protein FtsQ n=1 Tax=Pedobacter aquatilis TaxID=351343 RepID=UPI00292CFDF5|nr:cell division protein FtsQ [Pedobacter aquatilis]
MHKRINWSAIFTGFAWLVSLAGVVVLLSFINVKKQTVKCTNVKILIPGADNFIEREEVDQILREDQGVLVGRNLEQINIHQIEQKLQANPYIGFAKVYVDMDGVLNIEIKQRQPILRILNSSGQDFYIDNDGLKMPISPNFTANVLVATGNIQEVFGIRVDTLRTQMARDLYKTAQFIKRDTLWDNQIEQITVDSKNDIELIPRVGNQRIILGNADSLDIKMKNLLVFYKKAMPQVGWETYRTINIKYTNQIVCERRDSTLIAKQARKLTAVDSLSLSRKVTDSLVRAAIGKSLIDAADERTDEQKKTVSAAKPKVTKPEPAKTVVKKEPEKEKPKTIETAKEKPKVTAKTETKKAEPKKEEVKKATTKPTSATKPKTDTNQQKDKKNK